MNTFKQWLLIVLTICLTPLLVKAQFSMSGEFRPRTELSHGYKSLSVEDQDASLITTQRTRVNFNFNNEFLITKIALQDVRQWGSQPQLVGNEDFSASIHEAWVDIRLSDEISLKAGRQELVYDDQRIFGSVGWAQQARSHDLFLLKYNADWDVHLGIAAHQNSNTNNSNYNGPDAYKNMQFLWAHTNWEYSQLSLLLLNNGVPDPMNPVGVQEQNTRYSQTIGGRYSTQLETINISANLYYQGGKDASDTDLSAYNILLEASGDINDDMSLVGGFEVLSGSDYDESENKSFTPFYGTNHKFNGFMDYFFVGNHANSVGLRDLYGKLSVKQDDIKFGAHLHVFSSAAKIGPDVDDYLGTEIDLSADWSFKPTVNFSLGWSTILASDSMVLLKGGGDNDAFQHWGYFMITVKPDFIK